MHTRASLHQVYHPAEVKFTSWALVGTQRFPGKICLQVRFFFFFFKLIGRKSPFSLSKYTSTRVHLHTHTHPTHMHGTAKTDPGPAQTCLRQESLKAREHFHNKLSGSGWAPPHSYASSPDRSLSLSV